MDRFAALQVARRAAATLNPSYRTIYAEALTRRLLSLSPTPPETLVIDETHLVPTAQLEDVTTIPKVNGLEPLSPSNPIRGFSINEIGRWLDHETVVPTVALPVTAESHRMRFIEKGATRWAEGIVTQLLDLNAIKSGLHCEHNRSTAHMVYTTPWHRCAGPRTAQTSPARVDDGKQLDSMAHPRAQAQ